MNFQFRKQHVFSFIYCLFLVVGKFDFIKFLYSYSMLLTSILDAAIKVVRNTSANNLTFLQKDITYGS